MLEVIRKQLRADEQGVLHHVACPVVLALPKHGLASFDVYYFPPKCKCDEIDREAERQRQSAEKKCVHGVALSEACALCPSGGRTRIVPL